MCCNVHCKSDKVNKLNKYDDLKSVTSFRIKNSPHLRRVNFGFHVRLTSSLFAI